MGFESICFAELQVMEMAMVRVHRAYDQGLHYIVAIQRRLFPGWARGARSDRLSHDRNRLPICFVFHPEMHVQQFRAETSSRCEQALISAGSCHVLVSKYTAAALDKKRSIS